MSQKPKFERLQPTLGVRSVELAVAFYEGKLGFSVHATMGEPPTFALVGRDAVSIALVAAEAPAVAAFVAAYIYVDDVDAALAACERAGVPLAQPLTAHPWGNRDFVVRDPDGHQLAIGWSPHG